MVAVELPSPWRSGQASWPARHDYLYGFHERSEPVRVDTCSRHTSGVIKEIECNERSIDHGELRFSAVEHLLGTTTSQLGANFNQGPPGCQSRFLREVAGARYDGRLGTIDCGGRSFVGCCKPATKQVCEYAICIHVSSRDRPRGTSQQRCFKETPLGSKRLDMGPLPKRLPVNTVGEQSGPRAIHTFPSPLPGRIGFWERKGDSVRF
jgi:hypothetical protein